MQHVSSHWRESSDCQQLVITTVAERVSTKIAVLHAWRKDRKFRNSSSSFVVAFSIVLRDLASLLEGLTSQVESVRPLLITAYAQAPCTVCLTVLCAVQLDSLPNCSISVALFIAHRS